MKYIEEDLGKNEKLIYSTKLHWIIFVNIFNIFTLFILPILLYKFTEFGITNKRILIKEGVIGRNTTEIKNSKIESINIRQSILGRIFNFGTLHVVGSGGTVGTYKNISDPKEFKRVFNRINF
jgi:uncharacterized membrane protein YdbT with pleckstrin-like domain